EVVWSCRRGAGVKFSRSKLLGGDGGKRAVRRGEHEVSRKATAQGRPGCSACTCMLVCAFPVRNCTRDRGCSVHPVFPAPSDFRGREVAGKPRTISVARSRRCVDALRIEAESSPVVPANAGTHTPRRL